MIRAETFAIVAAVAVAAALAWAACRGRRDGVVEGFEAPEAGGRAVACAYVDALCRGETAASLDASVRSAKGLGPATREALLGVRRAASAVAKGAKKGEKCGSAWCGGPKATAKATAKAVPKTTAKATAKATPKAGVAEDPAVRRARDALARHVAGAGGAVSARTHALRAALDAALAAELARRVSGARPTLAARARALATAAGAGARAAAAAKTAGAAREGATAAGAARQALRALASAVPEK